LPDRDAGPQPSLHFRSCRTDVQETRIPSRHVSPWTSEAGIRNLFDADNPICFSCDLNSFDGTLYTVPGSFCCARIACTMVWQTALEPTKKAAIWPPFFFCPPDIGAHRREAQVRCRGPT